MDISQRTKGHVNQMTEEDLHGVKLEKITCRGCSGYGNCGYKTYRLLNGKVVSICTQRRAEEFQKLGIEED